MLNSRLLTFGVVVLVAVSVAACEPGLTTDPTTGSPSFARDNGPELVCRTIDLEQFDGGDVLGQNLTPLIPISVPDLDFTFDVTMPVVSGNCGGEAMIYDTQTGVDDDMNVVSQGNLLIAQSDAASLSFLGYPAGTPLNCLGEAATPPSIQLTEQDGKMFYVAGFTTVDIDGIDRAEFVRLRLDDNSLWWEDSGVGRGDSHVEVIGDDVPPEPEPAATTSIKFEIFGTGGVDDIQVCREELPGRMTGGGGQVLVGDAEIASTVGDRVTRGFTIHCDIALSNNIEINWPDNRWHIDKPLETAECIDDPSINPEPPPAPFDTFLGEAFGRLNNVDGSFLRFKFVDAGEPGGKADYAQIMIWAPGADPETDDPVLLVDQFLDHGNLQAHEDQPHRN